MPTFNFHPVRLLDPGCWHKFTHLITSSADPDQLASSEANWPGSTLFAKAEYIWVSRTKVLGHSEHFSFSPVTSVLTCMWELILCYSAGFVLWSCEAHVCLPLDMCSCMIYSLIHIQVTRVFQFTKYPLRNKEGYHCLLDNRLYRHSIIFIRLDNRI